MRRQQGNKRRLTVETLEDRSLLAAAPLEVVPPVVALPAESALPTPQAGEYTIWSDFEVPHNPFVQLTDDPGDANGDGIVDHAGDYAVWVDHYLQPGPWTHADGDFNGDTIVDGADYTIWADHFTQSSPPVETPSAAPLPRAEADGNPADPAPLELGSAPAAKSTSTAAVSFLVETEPKPTAADVVPGPEIDSSTRLPGANRSVSSEFAPAAIAVNAASVVSESDASVDQDSWNVLFGRLVESLGDTSIAESDDDGCWWNSRTEVR